MPQAKTYPIHSSYIYLLTALPFALECPLPGDFNCHLNGWKEPMINLISRLYFK